MTKLFETFADLSGYIFRITDNGGASGDRYTVAFTDGDYLAMSSYPSHPQGISISGEDLDPAVQQESVEEGREVDLALGDLPEGLAGHILARCNQGFEDFLETLEAKHPKAVAADRDAADVNEGLSTSVGEGIYLDGDAYKVKRDTIEDDLGPFATAREALLATLPDVHGLAGPEYHTTVDEIGRMEPDAAVAEAILALEARVEAGEQPRI